MIECENGKLFLCDECPLCENVEYRLAVAETGGYEPQLEYCSCDKIAYPFYAGGYCGDAFEDATPNQKSCRPRKTGRAYRRRMRQQKQANLMHITTYRSKTGNCYPDWGVNYGAHHQIGNHIRSPKNSNRQQFWKAYSNRKVRHYAGYIHKGNSYRKHFDYAWAVGWESYW